MSGIAFRRTCKFEQELTIDFDRFFAYILVMEDRPLYKRAQNVYFATLSWKRKEFEGLPYYEYTICSSSNPIADRRRLARALAYMNRANVRWDMHSFAFDGGRFVSSPDFVSGFLMAG